MKVALVQYNIAWEDKEANKLKILSLLDKINTSSVEWIVFPEMALSGFSMNLKKTNLNAVDVDFFKSIAKKFNSFVTFGGCFNNKNMAITLNPSGDIINEYAKIHLFAYGDETAHYEPGSKRACFSVKGLDVMPAVCYDLRFSYMFWDKAKKTDVFFVIASWPKSRADHWKTLLKARAIENQCYVIGVNRLGSDPKSEYSGDSAVYGPFGEEIINCVGKEGIFFAELLKDEVLKTREQYPFLNDRK